MKLGHDRAGWVEVAGEARPGEGGKCLWPYGYTSLGHLPFLCPNKGQEATMIPFSLGEIYTWDPRH